MRLRLTIAYAGTAYAGWQRQPNTPTVQGALEAALTRIAAAPVKVTGASRTDAGVHALGQVAHADVPERQLDWRKSLNAMLPADIRVLRAEDADAAFHARYGAIAKTYVYCIDTAPVAMPMLAPWCWHLAERLDLPAMRTAAAGLLGDIDQRAFATRPEPSQRSRPIDAVTIAADRTINVTVRGRSFLRFAVRGMVGALVQAGRGRVAPERVGEWARAGNRAAAPAPAPPHGLTLAHVEYAAQ